MKEYCVFHILTCEYIYCHICSNGTFYLLNPGVTYDYDSPTYMLRHKDPEILLQNIEYNIESRSFYYADRCIEEFEVCEFTENLVPLRHRWKEYNSDGSLTTITQRGW